MSRPRLLDLFCKAGGASMGYHLAGFDVTGVDHEPQPHYPFTFVLSDALAYVEKHGQEYDVITASPPCQAYSVTRSLHRRAHPQLIEPTRVALQTTGRPYVIENVEGAPLRNPLMLCGSMFPCLAVYRHRLFETSWGLTFPPATCNHTAIMPASKGAYHTMARHQRITCVGHNFRAADGRLAMGIHWMNRDELSQAIPPAYTQWIGQQLIQHLEAHA